MQLHPFDYTAIKEVKKQFSNSFPYLKLEFIPISDRQGGIGFKEETSEENFLKESQGMHRELILTIDPAETVAAFKQNFKLKYGIPVQVFRKSGNGWVEIIQTDYLSIAILNDMGKLSTIPIRFNANTLFL